MIKSQDKAKTFFMKNILLLLLGLMISVVFFILTHNLVNNTVQGLESNWQRHQNIHEPQRQAILNISLRSGYDGFIHHFKNYILRRDESYFLATLEDYQALQAYKNNLSSVTTNQVLTDRLDHFFAVIDTYMEKLMLAETMITSQKITPSDLDKLVVVDDSEAILAMQSIFQLLESETHTANDEVKTYVDNLGTVIVTISLMSIPLLILVGVGIYISNSARKLILETEQLAQQAFHASEAKSKFLANMSHEIRTPMNGILGISRLIGDAPTEHERNQLIAQISTSADALMRVINDVLDYSKIEQGMLTIDPQTTNIEELMCDIGRLMEPSATQKGIELLCPANSVSKSLVVIDSVRVRQVLLNLISNAIKFTSKGYVAVYVDLKQTTTNNVSLCFSVQDTGQGINQDDIKDIFNRFTQLKDSDANSGGTGLGLAISTQLVELMGGEITAESTFGEGSKFEFTLECQLDQFIPIDPPPIKESYVIACFQNGIYKSLLTSLFSNWKRKFDFTTSLDELSALAAGSHSEETILIIDCALVAETGSENIYPLKKPNIKTIVAHSTATDCRQYFSTDLADDVILKPIKASELFNSLSKLGTSFNTSSTQPDNDFDELPRFSARVLVAEDDLINQTVVSGLLNKLNIKFDIVGNGLEAIQALQQNEYDLILMDCMMPEMDGLVATQRIRQNEAGKQHANITVIALTANAIEGAKEECLTAGMNHYLSKPIDINELIAVFNKYLKPHC